MSFRKAFVSQMRLPGDIRLKAERDPYVAELAESIKKVGIVHPPVIRFAGRKVKVPITGKDILAALIKLGRPEFMCLAVECTHQEAYEMALASNLHRKQMTPEAAVSAASPLLTWPPFATGELPKEAREEISKSLTLLGAGHRSAPRRDGFEDDPEMPFRDLGCVLTPEFLREIKAVFVELSRAAYQLGSAAAALLRIRDRKLPFIGYHLEHLCKEVDHARASVLAALPFGLCPWCKGYDVECQACDNRRWMNQLQWEACPPKLLDVDDKVIVIDGVPQRLADVLEEA